MMIEQDDERCTLAARIEWGGEATADGGGGRACVWSEPEPAHCVRACVRVSFVYECVCVWWMGVFE